jgi:hypothetical protein
MKRPPYSSNRVSLEMGMIAFFVLAATSLLVVYLADPSIYAQSLSLTSSPADRYPVPVTLFLVGVLVLITLLIFGVVRKFRWLFWLILVAFTASAIQIPVEGLQLLGVFPMLPSDMVDNSTGHLRGHFELDICHWTGWIGHFFPGKAPFEFFSWYLHRLPRDRALLPHLA